MVTPPFSVILSRNRLRCITYLGIAFSLLAAAGVPVPVIVLVVLALSLALTLLLVAGGACVVTVVTGLPFPPFLPLSFSHALLFVVRLRCC